ncbi:hypothetical protein ACRAWD_04360 [Caulobacter segnis]
MFVDDPPTGFVEYAMAKAAGEILCADLNRRGGVRVLAQRLPQDF